MTRDTDPVLSVVIAIASDTTTPTDTRHLRPCLAALKRQISPPSMEIIVPLPTGVAGLEALIREYPEVRFLEFDDLKKYARGYYSREHHGELIARGFASANGRILALIEDHDVVASNWSSRLLEAHQRPFAGIGGAIENGVNRPLNWAIYFCDFLTYQNPLPEGESHRASDANVSYKRAALEAVRPAWEKEFHEAQVNAAIEAGGGKLALAPGVVACQHRQNPRLADALRERFAWGRSFGAWRSGQAGIGRRVFWAVFSPTLPLLLTARLTLMAARKGRTMGPFVTALPLTAILTATWALGEFAGYVTGRPLPSGAIAEPILARSQAVS